MKIIPDYYNKFSCIADKCKDNCCIGWEIEIDDKTSEKYKKVKGSLKERFANDICNNVFILKNNRCPFLNGNNLCDIQAKLGGDYLCKVCRKYPRFTVEANGIEKKGLSLSCEEAARIIFTHGDKVTFVKNGTSEQNFANEILYIENEVINILQDRKNTIPDRIKIFLNYLSEAQKIINDCDKDAISLLKKIKKVCPPYKSNSIKAFLDETCYIFEGLEVLNDEWTNAFLELKSLTDEDVSKFDRYKVAKRENWYENILVYFVHRYFIKASYDSNIILWAKFIFLSFFAIKGLAAIRYKNTGKFTLSDIISVSKTYSKEIEHSEENIDYILEEILFSEEFDSADLCSIIK